MEIEKTSEISWGAIVSGIVLLIIDAGIAAVGLFVMAFAADGGAEYATKLYYIFLIVFILVGAAGIYLIIKGSQVLRLRQDQKSEHGYIVKNIEYFVVSLFLTTLSRFSAEHYFNIVPNGTVASLLSPIGTLIGLITYFGILIRPWSFTRKTGLILLTFGVCFVLLTFLLSLLSN